MCGIAGIYSKTSVSKQSLICMTNVIAHRGPDGEGHWINSDETVGFGHRRLSIIDLTDAGKQPMHYLNNRYTITFNGEIYNYIELRNILLKEGYTFRSDCDTEVLLALYARDGKACLKLLDGMFAFAIYDAEAKTLFCARDRFGEKPFFYSYRPGQYFIFSSEIKQLFAAGISREFNAYQLYNYLENENVLTNPTDEHDTFYAEIKKLPKSCCLMMDKTIVITEEKYWEVDLYKKNAIKYEEAVEEFKYLFFESVNRRMRSDVPVGSSLSGGLDSSSIVCSIQKLFNNNNQRTFSARFENFHRDEGKFIQYVLDGTNVTPYSVWPSEEGFLNDIDNVIFHQDEPFPSASIYAQYCVMAEAKKQNVIVLLDGQGADEILAGYEYYLPYYLKELSNTNKQLLDEEMAYMQKIHPHLKFDNSYVYSGQNSMTAIPKKVTFTENLKNVIRPFYKMVNAKKYERIGMQMPLEGFYDKDFFRKVSDKKRYDFAYTNHQLNGYLKHTIEKDNLEDLLRFCDRNSMAHSREVRLPFLSVDLVEFLFSLPAAYKIKNGWTKAIMRDAMHGILPPEIERRTDKIGYEPPQRKWMENKKILQKIDESYEILIEHRILKRSSLQEKKLDWQVLNIAALIK